MNVFVLEEKLPLVILLTAANLKRSTYYYYRKNGFKDNYEELRNKILTIFNKSKHTYGYRKITQELRNQKKDEEKPVNHKLVQKLMTEMGIHSRCKKKWRNKIEGEENIEIPNILNRDFHSEMPFKKMTTDVSEFKIQMHKVFLSPLLDLYDNSVISFSIGLKQDTNLVMDMLSKAKKVVGNLNDKLIHSDQGTLYKTKAYNEFLNENKILQSMSRKGNCYDNAVIESFFGIMKDEMYNGRKFKSLQSLINEMKRWIYYYNNQRIILKLGGKTPIQARLESMNIV